MYKKKYKIKYHKDVETTSSFLSYIRHICLKEYMPCFKINAVLTEMDYGRDESLVKDYYLFGDNRLWGKEIKPFSGSYDVVNVHCLGGGSVPSLEYVIKYYITFQEKRIVIEPSIKYGPREGCVSIDANVICISSEDENAIDAFADFYQLEIIMEQL